MAWIVMAIVGFVHLPKLSNFKQVFLMFAESPVALGSARSSSPIYPGQPRLMKPGQRTGDEGGLYQQVDSLGVETVDLVLVSVPAHKPLPPTSKAGDRWMWVCVVESRHFRRSD